MLGYSLLRAVDFNKEADPDNIIDVALNFIHKSFFRSLSHSSGFGKNVIIFGADMPPSVHADEKKKNNKWYKYYFDCRERIFYKFY